MNKTVLCGGLILGIVAIMLFSTVAPAMASHIEKLADAGFVTDRTIGSCPDIRPLHVCLALDKDQNGICDSPGISIRISAAEPRIGTTCLQP